MANRSLCGQCSTQEIWLRLRDGTPIYSRLYTPSLSARPLPAVVVGHGYLANLGFMEVPWAADLTQLGIASLFVDQRGHGRSGGRLWPHTTGGEPLIDASPEIKAAIAYLRSLAPLVDPSRIALIGHSDGGTAVIMAASADWDIAATVSLSASVAPWEFVNHVAPANLLLVYGEDDHFVLQHTDELLIRSATRGYLDGEGTVGQLSDGSARRLLRIPGRGHIDLAYSEAARRPALEWLEGSLGLDGRIILSAPRTGWVVTGVVLLAGLLLLWHGAPSHRAVKVARSWSIWLKNGAVVGLWGCGLALAARWVSTPRAWVPAQEGAVVFGILGAELFLMGILVLAHRTRNHSARLLLRIPRRLIADIGRGVIVAVLFEVAFEFVLQPIYETPIDAHRVVMFLFFFIVALSAFAGLSGAAAWAADSASQRPRGASLEIALTLLTAFVAQQWFVRMSALPVYLLACALSLIGIYRAAVATGTMERVEFKRK